jgi:hypothetical protein
MEEHVKLLDVGRGYSPNLSNDDGSDDDDGVCGGD